MFQLGQFVRLLSNKINWFKDSKTNKMHHVSCTDLCFHHVSGPHRTGLMMMCFSLNNPHFFKKKYIICRPSCRQVAVLRAPSQHHCRDVFMFQTQPYSLIRYSSLSLILYVQSRKQISDCVCVLCVCISARSRVCVCVFMYVCSM